VAENIEASVLVSIIEQSELSNPQKNEFIIEYNPTIEAKMDIKILTCLMDNNWHYRQFSQGKTLEEKLFFEE
jgi:ABC-2 type transport system ATP-binding protein